MTSIYQAFFSEHRYYFKYSKIKKLCDENVIVIEYKYLEKLKSEAIRRMNILRSNPNKYLILSGGEKNKNVVNEKAKFLKENENPTLIGALCLIQRIRNNLFHGLKTLSDINDQYLLFESITNVFLNIKIHYIGS